MTISFLSLITFIIPFCQGYIHLTTLGDIYDPISSRTSHVYLTARVFIPVSVCCNENKFIGDPISMTHMLLIAALNICWKKPNRIIKTYSCDSNDERFF